MNPTRATRRTSSSVTTHKLVSRGCDCHPPAATQHAAAQRVPPGLRPDQHEVHILGLRYLVILDMIERTLRLFAAVRITGLTGKPELNGLEATVVHGDANENGRFQLQIHNTKTC